MKKWICIVQIVHLICLLTLIIGCASVPKEVVELSYRTGEDLVSLHRSYDKLIQIYFENMHSDRIEYLDELWYTRFLQNWMIKGELVAIAKGEKIWSEEEQKLIPTPPGSNPQEMLLTLRDWVDYALYAYEVKEESLIKPLDEKEVVLREEVERAFRQVMRANAHITAHLNSLREVQEVQDEVLEGLHIKDLRESINETLINVSEIGAKELENIKLIDEQIEDVTDQIEDLIK